MSPQSPEQQVIAKLHPEHLQTSGKFTAILGALLDASPG